MLGYFKKIPLQGSSQVTYKEILTVSAAPITSLNKRLGHFNTQNFLLQDITEKKFWAPTSDFSSLLLTSLLLDESPQYRIPARSHSTKIQH